ncbi:MAG: beta strand repeat-containing protein, partial [Planctomyces sp.]
FSGLQDGATISTDFGGSGKTARISYHAGDGNDIAIIVDEDTPLVPITGLGNIELELRMAEETLQVLINAAVVDTFVLDGIKNLTLGGRVGQNDVLRLSFAAANAELLSKLSMLTVNLGGDAGDDLIINANNGDVTVTHTAAGSGSVSVDALTLPFTGVGPNTLYIENSDDLTMTFGNSATGMTFTDHADATYSQVAGTGFTTTRFINPASSFIINLGTNDNTLAFTSMDAAFNPTTGVTINGGTGANSFTFTNFGSSFTGALNILGNAGTDSTTFTTSLTTTVINVQTETTTISGISLSTSGGNMTFGGDVALNPGNVTLNTTGGNLSIAGNLSGAQDLTLASGIAAGTTTIAGNVSNLGDGNGAALTIGSGITGLVWLQGSFAANSGITAFAGSSVRFNGDVTIADGSVGTTLPGAVTLDGLNWSSFDDVALGTVTLSSAAVSLTTNNGNLTFNGTVNGAQDLSAVAGTGTVIFANDVGSGTTIGSLTVTAATIQTSTGSDVRANGPVSFTATTANSLGGNITTCSDAITIIGNATLSSSVSLNTSSPGNSIQMTGTVEGTAANSQALTLNAGTAGTVTVTGSIGKTTALQSLTLTNSNGATFGTLESDTIQAKTSTVISNSVAGSTVLFNGALVTDSLTSSGNAYHLHLAGTGSIIGTTSLQNAGQAIFGNSSADILLFVAPLSVTVPSSVELFGQIRTQRSTVLLGDSNTPVNLRSADSVVDTTNNMDPLFLIGATITFGSVIEGKTGAGSENLALNAGTTGDVVFAGTIGAARRMGTLHLRGLRNTILPSVTAQTLLQTTGTGTTTFNGTVNTTSATGVDVTTTNIIVNALITTIVDGSVPA